jgi:hypothetical protein
MNRLFVTSVLAFGLGFAAMPASAVVYCMGDVGLLIPKALAQLGQNRRIMAC